MLRFARVLPIALVAVLASCADHSREVTAPARTEPIRFSTGDAEVVISAIEAMAEYIPGKAGKGPMVAAAMIGPQGGTLRLDDFEVVVPPGAVTHVRRFEIRQMPAGPFRRHAMVWFAPHNAHFAVPVTIRLPLATTESWSDPSTPVLWWNEKAWEPLATTPTADGRIEARTTHFSLYATAARRGFTTVGG